MSAFQKVAQVSQFSDNELKLIEVDDRLVILIKQDDQFYCIDDVCTHDGGTLSGGKLEGCEISCPRHGARFDIRNGKALTMPATEATGSHQVKVDGDDVFVRIIE